MVVLVILLSICEFNRKTAFFQLYEINYALIWMHPFNQFIISDLTGFINSIF